MAAEEDSVKPEPHPAGEPPVDTSPGVSPWELVPPGITVRELFAAVGDLEIHDGGFADALEAVQAEQPIAEVWDWPDWPPPVDSDDP